MVIDCSELDNPTDHWSEPVVAWGVRLDGTLVPITPAEPAGLWSAPPLIRRKGESSVFHPSEGYKNMDDYFSERNALASIRTAD